MRLIPFFSLLVLITPTLAGKFRPQVPWGPNVRFVYDRDISDNFQENELDLTKWDPHGVRVPETGCPRWNGPPSSDYPDYSTFFPTTTDPATGEPTVKQYRFNSGKLLLKMDEKPLQFFTAREYYCNATTFKCNHDDSINCFATDIFGNPRYKDKAKTMFRAAVHDKCKKEPFCIPHPELVTGKPRVYKRFVGAHLTGKQSFKYGYVEVYVKLGYSPAVAGAWMHDNNLVNGFCRLIEDTRPGKSGPRLECPSVIRSRRWQEIDILEAMNSRIHRRRFIPNIHIFAGYKGEFTSRTAMDNGDGNVGGGPIIVQSNIFDQRRPNFSDVPESERLGNDYHYNPGSVFELDRDWAKGKRKIGMYWSPNEIRFLIDGKEVRRVKNNLVHQPMFLDLSYALNVAWAQEFPLAKHIRQEVKYFHFRRWRVYTRDGVEPPSDLPLDTDQERDFLNLYGDELGGVFGRFPANDNLTIMLTNPDMPDTMEGSEDEEAEATPEDIDVSESSGRSVVEKLWSGEYWRSLLSVDMRRKKGRSKRKEATEEEEVAELLKQGFSSAGGEGNVRFPTEVGMMSGAQRRIAESRTDRMAIVGEDGKAEMIGDAETSLYDISDPNEDGAGWSMPDGMGMSSDDPRMKGRRFRNV